MKHGPASAPGSIRIFEPNPGTGLSEENAHYLGGVMRLRSGDSFWITDGQGGEYPATFRGNRTCTIGSRETPGREPELSIILFPALTKGDLLEWVIEKAVELGVPKIVPVISQRCIVREPGRGKLERWRKIALAAMLQSGGCRLPEVAEPILLANLPSPATGIQAMLLHEKRLASEPGTSRNRTFGVVPPHQSGPQPAEHWILSGPEGGFSDEEVTWLVSEGWVTTWLGPRRLRAETAPLAALSALLLGQY